LCLIPLIAPTTSAARAKKILKGAAGFVYYILVRGVTGGQSQATDEARDHLAALQAVTQLPIAAGFGIREGRQAAGYAQMASAVVVGSALVEAAREGRLAEKVTELHSALAIIG
jgi:tryptophan synthase alpha chain